MFTPIAYNRAGLKRVGMKPALNQSALQKPRVDSMDKIQFGAEKKPKKKIDYDALARQTTQNRIHGAVSSRIHFRLETDERIPRLDTYKLQEACFYPYDGYGHSRGKTQEYDPKLKKYVTTFSCAGSCD
jgi:hypothetical protein